MRDEIIAAALKEALRHHRGGIQLGTGVGKTKLALEYINHFYTDSLRVLVLAPKLTIFEAWKHEIHKFNLDYLGDHIDFSTYLSIDKCSLEYDILILDECHSLLESQDPWLSQFKGRILGLSGTFPRYEHSEKGKMVDKYCPLVYEYNVDAAVSDKILNDYRIIVHPLQLSKEKTLWKKKKDGSGWMSSEAGDYQSMTRWVNNAGTGKEKQIASVMRMKALMGYKTKEEYAIGLLAATEKRCILFGNTQEQVDRMCMFTCHSNNQDSDENLELFRTGQIMKLGAVLQLNEGVNVPVQEEIIMHSYGNERKLAQRIGRGLRLNPDETVTVNILMFEDTIDATWVSNALSDFDPGKITYKNQLVKT